MSGTLQHLAIVMDGNGRWASHHGYPRSTGHRQGLETSLRIIEAVAERGIAWLSLFALSCENMARPRQELTGIEDLILLGAPRFRKIASRYGISLRVIGDQSVLSATTGSLLADLIAENNNPHARLHLQVAVNYSGQWDILQALNRICRRQTDAGRAGTPASIGGQEFAGCLSTAGSPNPDLLIRTGGESRLSNFMLWQLAYTELYFHDRMWPEFDVADLDEAIASYEQRERRFGLVKARTRAG